MAKRKKNSGGNGQMSPHQRILGILESSGVLDDDLRAALEVAAARRIPQWFQRGADSSHVAPALGLSEALAEIRVARALQRPRGSVPNIPRVPPEPAPTT